MKLDIRLPDGTTKQVKAHRVLKNTYPTLELYIHIANTVEGKAYNISDYNGMSIGSRAYGDIFTLIVYVKSLIDKHSEEIVYKICKEIKIERNWFYDK